MSKSKIIHVGANKTASTTLQRALFSKSKSIKYLGEDCANYESYKDILNSLISDDDFHYDHKLIEDLFNKYILSAKEKTFVY